MTRLDGFVDKGWGSELIWATNDKYCGKLLKFNKDARFKVVFIETRNASQHEAILKPGTTWRNRPLQPHQVICLEAGTIIEVSTPDSVEDNYRVLPGDSQK